MLTIACYSEHTAYQEEAELLAASLRRVGMTHRIEGFPSRGDWYANTAEKARFIRRMRSEQSGPLLYVDVDAFVHHNCDAYFEELAGGGFDFGAHWYRGPAHGADRTQVRPEGWRMLSGTLFLGDTERCRRLVENWTALNELWRSVNLTQGAGQKNLWFTLTCMPDVKVMRLPGEYCYVADRFWAYEKRERERVVIEHTIASRDHRAIERQTASRANRVAQLRRFLARPYRAPDAPTPTELIMADPMRAYWIDRYKRQGKFYVARGGKPNSFTEQRDALVPQLRLLVGGRRVLDFGCGPQRFRDVLEEGGRQYVGVDLIPGLGTQPLADELPRGFDTAVCILVLQHITDPAIYRHWIRQLYESLNPGGRLVVIDHMPRPDMEGHMRPRGLDGLTALAPWTRAEITGEYDGHWIGILERGVADLPFEEPQEAPIAEAEAVGLLPAAPAAPAWTKCALVLGGAASVWEDVRAVETMIGGPWPGLVIAVNDVGSHWPRRLDHWCTLHPEKMPGWLKDRTAAGHPDGYTTWARRKSTGIARTIESWAGGSSGLLGVALACGPLECERVILCGVPMNRDPHFAQSKVHPKGKPWTSCDAHWKSWTKPEFTKRMQGRVKSMGGRTRDLLGAPDPEWLGVHLLQEQVA